jgi:hypothetical protein
LAPPLEDALHQVDGAAERQAEQVGEVRRVEDGDDVDVVVQVAADAGRSWRTSMPSERRCARRCPTASAAAATQPRRRQQASCGARHEGRHAVDPRLDAGRAAAVETGSSSSSRR